MLNGNEYSIIHTYDDENTYIITLALDGGADRWTFEQNQRPLVPKD
jgi:hypothetical protein